MDRTTNGRAKLILAIALILVVIPRPFAIAIPDLLRVLLSRPTDNVLNVWPG